VGTNSWKLYNGLMISNKLLRPSFDVEKNESGPFFLNLKIDNH
jgi:hypothetical protein